MSDSNGLFVKHTACPACGSSDNLAVYLNESPDGDSYSAYCFGGDCSSSFSHNELIDLKVIDGDFVVDKTTLKKPRERITQEQFAALSSITNKSAKMADRTQYREFKDEYVEFFGHRFERNSRGQIIAVYYPETLDGKLQGFKSRVLPKRFGLKNIGKTGLSNDLSGQHLYTGGRDVLIVGGEEDKVAAYQMLREYQISKNKDEYDGVAVVSPTCGEGSAVKQVAQNYDWFNRFENIVVMMDNDEAGNKAALDIAAVLPKEKVKIARLSMKDPCDMLRHGRHKQFVANFYDAQPLVNTGVKTSKDADDEIEKELGREKIPLPPFMEKLQQIMCGGIPLGYIVNLGAVTGGGKTSIVNEMIYYWIFNSPHKIGIVSLELTAGQYMTAMLSRHIGKKIQLIEDQKEAVAFVQQDWVKEKRKELRENEYGEERFVILDDRDGSLDAVKLQMNRLIKKHNCKLIVLDPINDLFEGATLEQQTDFIKYLKLIIKDGVSVFNVCHITKGKTETDRDGKRKVRKLTEDDFSGVSNLAKSAGCNIFATRDKYAECEIEKNTTLIEVPKCRWTGRTGVAGEWFYDLETHTLHDKETYFKNKYGESQTVAQVVPLEYTTDVYQQDF